MQVQPTDLLPPQTMTDPDRIQGSAGTQSGGGSLHRAARAAEAADSGDRAELSATVRAIASRMSDLAAPSARLRQLAEDFARGLYEPDADHIAEALVREAFAEGPET